MGVFNNSVKIGVRVPDPGTDKNLPPPGALSYTGITTAAALAGTTGIDCKLVHGNRWQEIQGNMTEDYTGSVTTNITQNENINVTGIVTLNVTAGWNENQYGPMNRTYYMVVNDTFLSDHNVSVPASFAFTVAMFANTLTIATQIGIVTGLSVQACTALSLTLANFDFEYKLIHAEFHQMHGDGKEVELYAVEAKVKLHGDQADVGGATNVKAKVNAGVHLEPPAPVG